MVQIVANKDIHAKNSVPLHGHAIDNKADNKVCALLSMAIPIDLLWLIFSLTQIFLHKYLT